MLLLSWVARGGAVLGVGTGRGTVLHESGQLGCQGGVGRALVSAVDWVTGRRAGAPELPTGEGDARAAAERQCHRAPATGPPSELRG